MAELRMKADADAAEVARHKVRQLALADAEEKRRQEREAAVRVFISFYAVCYRFVLFFYRFMLFLC